MIYNATKYPLFLYLIYDTIKIIKNFIPLLPIKGEIDETPFFIISSGRSRTTLLRSMLCVHPLVSIPPESYILPTVVRKYIILKVLGWEDIYKIVCAEFESQKAFKYWRIDLQNVYIRLKHLDRKKRSLTKIIDEIYKEYTYFKFPGVEIWGDKTPSNIFYLKWIDKVFNKVKSIHIVRDGRDVVCSQLKKNVNRSLEEASKRWIRSVQISEKFKKKKSNSEFIEIRNEDLVTNLQRCLKNICSFLNIDCETKMLNFSNITVVWQ